MRKSISIFLLVNVLCGLGKFLGQAYATKSPARMSRHHLNRDSPSSGGKSTNEQVGPPFRSSPSQSKNVSAFQRACACSFYNLRLHRGQFGEIPCSRNVGIAFPFLTQRYYASVSIMSENVSRRRQEDGDERSNHVAMTTRMLRGGGDGDSSGVMAAAATSVIPFSSWLIPGVSCATAYALYNLFIKKSASHDMDPILGGVILQFVAAVMGSVLYLGQRVFTTTSSTTIRMISHQGVQWSMAAGLAVGAAELLSFIVSGKGVPATQSIPVIVGGSILVGSILGTLWLQERLSPRGWVGVVLIAAGIVLVGMDPSSSGSWGH